MAKIHTHYDNLKVARLAPQEVIRAAYKALSQKYHPDKNPGDEKAARIMAILNSAYGTLSDTQRRREHDEWIAAEEWEIEWLESTNKEEKGGKRAAEAPAQAWDEPMPASAPAPYRARRDWLWWASLAACLVLGWIVAIFTLGRPAPAPGAFGVASAGEAGAAAAAPANPARADGKSRAASKNEAIIDSWAVARPEAAEPVFSTALKVAAVSQVVLPEAPVECEFGTQTRVAPNGEAWPRESAYVAGFPVGNRGDDLQLTLDNARNALPVFVRLYDQDRRSNVRYAYILPRDKFTIEHLSFGRYEVRFQNVDLAGAGRDGCARQESPETKPAQGGAAPAAGAAAPIGGLGV